MHAHMGINSVPAQLAVRFKIPLMIWGEHGFMNMGGMHSYKDMVDYTPKYRREHLLRGQDWQDFVVEEGLDEKYVLWSKYPDDELVEKVELRGIFISNFFGWNQAEHTQMMVDLYGFEINPIPFNRTYERDANLNNFHDNFLFDQSIGGIVAILHTDLPLPVVVLVHPHFLQPTDNNVDYELPHSLVFLYSMKMLYDIVYTTSDHNHLF